jgi:hypothetical protein
MELEDIVNQLPSEEVRRQPHVLLVEGGEGKQRLLGTQPSQDAEMRKKSFIRDVKYGVYIFLHVLILSSLSYNNISGFKQLWLESRPNIKIYERM